MIIPIKPIIKKEPMLVRSFFVVDILKTLNKTYFLPMLILTIRIWMMTGGENTDIGAVQNVVPSLLIGVTCLLSCQKT